MTSQPTRIIYSGGHGFALYFSRLIRSMWSDCIFEDRKTLGEEYDELEFNMKLFSVKTYSS